MATTTTTTPSSGLDAHPPRLLLVEDEDSLAAPLTRGLEEDGYLVATAADGRTGLREALSGAYDLMIVDWRLPEVDGLSLVRRLRAAGDATPVLMLTALHEVGHRVAGLDAGADDYLAKPFSFEELLARLRALLRRTEGRSTDADLPPETEIRVGSLEVDPARRTAAVGGRPLQLRNKEQLLLELLAGRAGSVVPRHAIAERVWGSAFGVTDNAIDITVSTLRAKLRQGNGPGIETVRGVGYRLTEYAAAAAEEDG
ncbi:MAG: response regulator transcription factor [Thermoanaerobaculia bacterium]|nr:response regulator transcription factor [Thermoanaerobaculia bacterium]